MPALATMWGCAACCALQVASGSGPADLLQGCAAITTVLLLRLRTLVCRDKVFLRCTSERHADQPPYEINGGNGISHDALLRGDFGCKACFTMCVFMLFPLVLSEGFPEDVLLVHGNCLVHESVACLVRSRRIFTKEEAQQRLNDRGFGEYEVSILLDYMLHPLGMLVSQSGCKNPITS